MHAHSFLPQACGCGKTTLRFACWEAAGLDAASQRCSKLCHRALPNCVHACQERCHAGACPGATSCWQEVTLRCTCKRRKEKALCSRAAELLRAAGGNGAYDATTSMRLLPCDAECARAGAAAAQGSASRGAAGPSSPGGEEGTAAKGSAVPASEPQPAQPAGKRDSRAERQLEKERQRLEQAAKARRRQKVQLVALCVLCLVALLLVYSLLTLAIWFEGVLHKWSGPQEL